MLQNGAMLWAHDKLRLQVTDSCNAYCPHCHNEGMVGGQLHMPMPLVEHILKVARDVGLPTGATITGGEALLHPRIGEIISAVRASTKSVTLCTNGLLLDSLVAKRLAVAGVGKVRIDVDPHRMEGRVFSRYGFPMQTLGELVSRVKGVGIPVELNTVLTAYSDEQLRMLIRFCCDHATSIKCFQRVLRKARPTGTPALVSTPDVALARLEAAIQAECGPIKVATGELPARGDRTYQCDRVRLRYCEFLCTFGACSLSGTRFDPYGRVSTCISGFQGCPLSPGEATEETVVKIVQAIQRGCCTPPVDLAGLTS